MSEKCSKEITRCVEWENVCEGEDAERCVKFEEVELPDICLSFDIGCKVEDRVDSECEHSKENLESKV